ncbi:hypothetical protein ABXT60_08620 [Candidatus Njordibacter sp. Uisw_056]|jgi:hypothetical protein|uniref:hypothetical protein n=1 Tax=Candidatus Njordibacter sp. Uisw_056 TaxID=3230973 RepID=UPI003D3FE1D5|tara:strand:- start:129 stop:593 length:465 start_codon:yes stop_codon:yes gene_type:complete
MKLRFICATHKQELRANTEKALKFCQIGFDTGQFYNDHLQWQEAIPHLGCAFEAAEILLSHSNIDNQVSCDWLAASAQLLAINFNNLQHVSQAEDVIWMAINRLEEQLVQHPSQALWMDQYLVVLYDDLKTYITMAAKVNGPVPKTRESVAVMH